MKNIKSQREKNETGTVIHDAKVQNPNSSGTKNFFKFHAGSKDDQYNNKTLRRYSFDDNGGGYEGL